jgi:superfamily II DNA or RNA helicase
MSSIPELRPYQTDAVGRVRDALRRSRRVLLTSPTGSGKTIMFAWLACAVAAHGSRILILAHRTELAHQISEALTAFGVAHGLIAAGRPTSGEPVQVAMVLTLINRLYRHNVVDYDLVVVDEAHHSVASSWQRILAAFPQAYLLGVTATPERLDGRPLRDLYDELVMAPTVTELVAAGFLSPAVTYAAPVSPDLTGIRTRLGDFEQGALAERMTNGKLIGDAVEHYRKLSPQLPGLAYCVGIAHSMATAEAFNGAGFSAVHVDGETPKDERRQAIADLGAGKLDLITNCGLFSEGVDVPLLGLVIMLRPTQSLALYLQMAGRALRIGGGKRRALILDHAGNWERHGLYDFPHCWSLEGREKSNAGQLVRRCPQCDAVIPIATDECPECGFEFVRRLATGAGAPRIPETMPGELERVDGERAQYLRAMAYRSLLRWIGSDPQRAEEARRARGYKRGWAWHVLSNAA